MDKASTIIGLGLVVLTALPFIIYNLYKKMKKSKFLMDFIELSEKAKLKFSQHEVWKNSFAIGIDADSNKLLYFNKNEGKEDGTLIDLSSVEKCRMVTTDRHVKSQNSINDRTNRLELVFTYANSGKPETVIEFYKNPEFMPSVDEIAHVEGWLSIINSNLKTSQK
jgi:hypothetical protein